MALGMFLPLILLGLLVFGIIISVKRGGLYMLLAAIHFIVALIIGGLGLAYFMEADTIMAETAGLVILAIASVFLVGGIIQVKLHNIHRLISSKGNLLNQ